MVETSMSGFVVAKSLEDALPEIRARATTFFGSSDYVIVGLKAIDISEYVEETTVGGDIVCTPLRVMFEVKYWVEEVIQ